MFDIKTKVIIESATVTLDAVQLRQLAGASKGLDQLLSAASDEVSREVWPVREFCSSLAELVDGAVLAGTAPKGKGRGGKPRNPTPGEPV